MEWQPVTLNQLVEMLDEDTGEYRYTRCPRGRTCIRHRSSGDVFELDLRAGAALRMRRSPDQVLAELVTH